MTAPIASRTVRLILGAVCLAACASTSPEPAFRDVARTVEERTGQKLRWDRGTNEDDDARRAIRGLLDRELTVDQAVQIALLKNPALRGTLEELSISQADLVQAGLLRNPTFSASMTTAERDALDPNLVLGVAWDFLDLLTMPLRKNIARAALERTKLRVADSVLLLSSQVRAAFFALQGAQQIAEMRRIVAGAAQLRPSWPSANIKQATSATFRSSSSRGSSSRSGSIGAKRLRGGSAPEYAASRSTAKRRFICRIMATRCGTAISGYAKSSRSSAYANASHFCTITRPAKIRPSKTC